MMEFSFQTVRVDTFYQEVQQMIPKVVISFLSKPDGGFVVFKLDESGYYRYVQYQSLPINQYYQIEVQQLVDLIQKYQIPKEDVEVFVVKPDGRKTDDTKTLFRIGYNTVTVKAVIDILQYRVYSIRNSRLWQDYFYIDQTNTKESALSKAKELLPNTPIESTEQAEAILIGIYGIETVIKKKILNKEQEELNIQLSKNFRTEELQCKCCNKCEINPKLVECLQLLRDTVGVPIYINSGYRCKKHNAEVGGSSNSQHTKGNAADIRIKGMSVKQMYEVVKELGCFTGVGIYPEQNFIHIDIRENPAIWVYVKSKRKYLTLDQFQKELEKNLFLKYDYTTIRAQIFSFTYVILKVWAKYY